MPITVCTKCGGRWDHPSGWLAHMDECCPERKKLVIAGVRGLMDEIASRRLEETEDGQR